jgi:hypothetical protein
MRVVVWNCNRGLAGEGKTKILSDLDADIAVVAESAAGALPEGRSVWAGTNRSKGLGVISRSDVPRIAACYDDSLRWFIPVQFDKSRIKLLAVWAFNHRDRLGGRSTLAAAVDRYSDFLSACDVIIAGDMNNNLVWDTPGHHSFVDATSQLDALGYASAYHDFFDEAYGSETRPTFRHSSGRMHHIDYCFLPKSWLRSTHVEVGPFAGDHTPLVVDFADPS